MDVISTYEEDADEEVEWDDEVEDDQVDYLMKLKRDGYKFSNADFRGGDRSLAPPIVIGTEEKKGRKRKPSKRAENVRNEAGEEKNVRAKKEKEEAKPVRKQLPRKARESRARKTTAAAVEEEEGVGVVVEELKSWMLVQLKELKKEILNAVEEKNGKAKGEGGGSTEGKANVRGVGDSIEPDGGNQRAGKQMFSKTESEHGSFKIVSRRGKRALHTAVEEKASKGREREQAWKKMKVGKNTVSKAVEESNSNEAEDEEEEKRGVDDEMSTWKYYGGTWGVLEELGVEKEEGVGKEEEELREADGVNVEEVGGEKNAEVAAKVDDSVGEEEGLDLPDVGEKRKMKTDMEMGCMDGQEENVVEMELGKEVVADKGGGKDREGENEEVERESGEKAGEGNESERVVVQVRK